MRRLRVVTCHSFHTFLLSIDTLCPLSRLRVRRARADMQGVASYAGLPRRLQAGLVRETGGGGSPLPTHVRQHGTFFRGSAALPPTAMLSASQLHLLPRSLGSATTGWPRPLSGARDNRTTLQLRSDRPPSRHLLLGRRCHPTPVLRQAA